MADLSLSPRDTDGIPWISSTPNGTWTYITDGIAGELTIGVALATIIFFGIFTTFIQTSRGFGVGIFYIVLVLFFTFAWFIESREPGTRALSVIDLGGIGLWPIAVPVGLGFGVLFGVLLNFATGAFLPFESLTIFGVEVELIVKILAPVVAIPIAEELFFGGFMTPTTAEQIGIVPASAFVSLTWVMWHLGTYQSSVIILGALVAFRVLATFVILFSKSLLPMIVAHIVINFLGTFFIGA